MKSHGSEQKTGSLSFSAKEIEPSNSDEMWGSPRRIEYMAKTSWGKDNLPTVPKRAVRFETSQPNEWTDRRSKIYIGKVSEPSTDLPLIMET